MFACQAIDAIFRYQLSCCVQSIQLLACLTLLCLCLGCDTDTGRHRVSGSIILDGKPVPAGLITFEPDFKQGNTGPQGIAPIEDGRYDTNFAGGRGIVGGPHKVRILGYAGKSVPPGASDPSDASSVKVLLKDYETEVDLAVGDATHDFNLTSPVSR